MDPVIVANIQERLAKTEADHGVSIPLAVESGSRAWGFPSPDSDYDCRFVYIRSAEDYLSPWPKRDVIETPLDAVYDVNGWDFGKTLKLLVKGNAVAIEWLMSPIVYRRDEAFRTSLLDFAREAVDRDRIIRHYLHLGERQRRAYFRDEKSVPRKKVFYALRPAAALRWLRLHPGDPIAPMNFVALMEECDPPHAVIEETRVLLAEKARTSEMGSAPLTRSLAAFIESEFEHARRASSSCSRIANAQARAESLFLEMVRKLAHR